MLKQVIDHFIERKKRPDNKVKKLEMDKKQLLTLWQQHLENYQKREELCKHFSKNNINNTLKNFDVTISILEQIKALISLEIINIDNEEKLDKEIITDLEKLKPLRELERLTGNFVHERNKQTTLLSIFQEIHDILKIELHLITLIKKRPSNVKELLFQLFTLIFRNEAELYKPFMEHSFFEKEKYFELLKIITATLNQKEVESETVEEALNKILAEKVLEQMRVSEEELNEYRELGEDIYIFLANIAIKQLPEGDIVDIKGKMDELVKDNTLLYKIIKKLKSKYDDEKINAVIIAFHEAFTEFDYLDEEINKAVKRGEDKITW
jgi:hypothetical protein